MDQQRRQKISRTCFLALVIFLGMAFVFAMGRNVISQINIWLLTLTGEVTIIPSSEKPIDPELVFQQQKLQEANKLNKVTAPVKQQSPQANRKRPVEQGYYTTPEDHDPDELSIISVSKKQNLALNPENWRGPDDLSFRCRLIREKAGFRVIVVVKDDILWAKNDKIQHMNDCVEIYFDVRPGKKRGQSAYEKGVYHALIVPWYGNPANANTMIFHFKNDEKMPDGCWVKSSGIKDFGYRVEVYFPFSMFAYPPDEEFNFDVGVIDFDSSNSGKMKQMVWSGTKDNFGDALWFGHMKRLPKELQQPGAAAKLNAPKTKTPAPSMKSAAPTSPPAAAKPAVKPAAEPKNTTTK